MSLEEQIAQIVDPFEFTRLCNTIFAAEHGHDFQVIDGTRGDEGNDGWVKPENRILAIHCPIKPERKTDAGIRDKAFDDLDKARKLRDDDKIKVERWTFVTPRKLSNAVIVDITNKARELGIAANHIEATHLAIRLLRHPELIKEFPQLHVSQLEELVRSALESAPESLKIGKREPEDDIRHFLEVKLAAAEDEEVREIVKLRESEDARAAKPRLRAMFYRSSNPHVQLNAIFGLVDLFAPMDDDARDLANLCETAIGAAKRLDSRSAEGYLLAQRGYLLSFEFGKMDLQRRANAMAEARIGFPLTPPQKIAAIERELQQLGKAFSEAFKLALQLASESGSPLAMAAVLISLGNAAGNRALYLRQFGATGEADAERDVCKKALLYAKDLYAALGRELDVANAQMNLANQIRFLGEEQVAKELVASVIPIAEKHGDRNLLKKATWLKKTLESGKIPDYLAGERRE